MKHLKVEGYSNLYRDPSNNCIINKNKSEYNEYISKKYKKNEENQKIQNFEVELAIMKDDINEIKNLLLKLTNDEPK